MIYNLSIIMTKANNLRKVYGMSKSEALTKAWNMAKLENIESDIFMLKMKDRWNQSDFAISNKMNTAANELRNKIYPTVTKIVTIDPIASKRNRLEKELAELGSRLGTDSNAYIGYYNRNLAPFMITAIEETVLDENAYDAA